MNLALLASGNGSNVQAIIDGVNDGRIKASIQCLVCDQPGAYVIKRAKGEAIPVFSKKISDFGSKKEWEENVLEFLNQFKIDYVLLAGFMRILGKTFLSAYPNKILNIHPSLLPAFPGKNSIEDTYNAGVSQTGVSIFYVDDGIDTGEIIAQEKLQIKSSWTLEELESEIHKIEHRLYLEVIKGLQ